MFEKNIADFAAELVDKTIKANTFFDMGTSFIKLYKENNITLKVLFIKAFKQSVDNILKNYNSDSIRCFLENCREVGDVYGCESLYDYLRKINNEIAVPLSDNDIKKILSEITEQLNYIVLNDNNYKDLYNVFSHYQLNSILLKLDKINDIVNKCVNLLDNNNLEHFDEKKLLETNLCGANLTEADLYCANLRNTDLSRANLHCANLRNADLSRANLCFANLSGANIYEVEASHTKYNQYTIFPKDFIPKEPQWVYVEE